jgi:hypothetical protein
VAATQTTGGGSSAAIDPRLTPNRKLFAQQVSRGTGLNETVVDAWVLAEGGPDTNPLNIGPGKSFASAIDAAAAVVRLLHTPTYKPILDSATNTPEVQIAAIAASPWNGGFNAAPKVHRDYGALIRGVYEHLKPSSSGDGGGVGLPSLPSLPGLPNIPNPIDGVAVSGAESWAAGAALSAAAYLLLTVAALALFALGINQVFGGAPGRAAAGLATRTPAGEAIPF